MPPKKVISVQAVDIPEIGSLKKYRVARRLYNSLHRFRNLFWILAGFCGIAVLGMLAKSLGILSSRASDPPLRLGVLLILVLLAGIFGGIGRVSEWAAAGYARKRFSLTDWFVVMRRNIGRGDLHQARIEAEVVIEYEPDGLSESLMVASAHQFLANRCEMSRSDVSDHWSTVLSLLEQAIQQGANSVGVKINRAMALEKLSRFDEAMDACEEVTNSSADVIPLAYMIRAASLEGAGRLNEANEAWEQIQQQAPKWPNGNKVRLEAKQYRASATNAT